MASESFHLFTSLPFELRRMIYLLATPPRLVRPREVHEDRRAFMRRFRANPFLVKPHPDIVSISRRFGGSIPHLYTPDGQLATLETCGLSDGQDASRQPAESARAAHALPLLRPYNAEVAFELVRWGYFYSTAPIPVLLHVTRESRSALMDYGYELTFRTRTCGPRIWFNFKTDVLYFDAEEPRYRSLLYRPFLSGSSGWDTGQFEPDDLRRVKRIALGEAGQSTINGRSWALLKISGIIECLKGVEELFLEEDGLGWHGNPNPSHIALDDMPPRVHIPVLEVDAWSCLTYHEPMVHSTRHKSRVLEAYNRILEMYKKQLEAYKEEHMGDGTGYFVDVAASIEAQLVSYRDKLMEDDPLTPWKIPKVRIVYIHHP